MATTLPSPPEAQVAERPIETPTPSASQTATSRNRHPGVAGGVILIALGVAALFSTWAPAGAGAAWLFLALGTAFLLARLLTGTSGFAIPAGLLLGFGTFVWLTETATIIGPAANGLFFICLGVGFLASYAFAARPHAVWPVLPGLLLIGFGAVVQGATFGVSYPQLWLLVQYWPVILVAIGAWLLLRDRIPESARTPVATLGTAVLILIGLLIAAATIASVGLPTEFRTAPMPMPWPMLHVPVGRPPLQDTLILTAPVGSVSSIQSNATSGSTLVRSVDGTNVTVQATRHFWNAGSAPDVRLVPSGGTLLVQTSSTEPSDGTYVDYVIDAPPQLGALLRSESGSITAKNIDGPVSISTASGSVFGVDLARVADVRSMSGSIDLVGDFGAPGQITSVSGSVDVGFTPAASVHIVAASTSGDVHAEGLELTGTSTTPHALIGDLAHGGPTLSVRTTSGSIHLVRAP